jgi:hypothetical protein
LVCRLFDEGRNRWIGHFRHRKCFVPRILDGSPRMPTFSTVPKNETVVETLGRANLDSVSILRCEFALLQGKAAFHVGCQEADFVGLRQVTQ